MANGAHKGQVKKGMKGVVREVCAWEVDETLGQIGVVRETAGRSK